MLKIWGRISSINVRKVVCYFAALRVRSALRGVLDIALA